MKNLLCKNFHLNIVNYIFCAQRGKNQYYFQNVAIPTFKFRNLMIEKDDSYAFRELKKKVKAINFLANTFPPPV